MATAGLVLVIVALTRNGRAHLMAFAVGGYITAYWFTSSPASPTRP